MINHTQLNIQYNTDCMKAKSNHISENIALANMNKNNCIYLIKKEDVPL